MHATPPAVAVLELEAVGEPLAALETLTSRHSRSFGARGISAAVGRVDRHQTVRRLRPLRRRRDRMARPWRVFMRDRKPCFFLRRRLFG